MKGLRSPSSVEARERFLAALARGESVASAARFAGIARQVPYVWASRNDDVVRDALAAARRARGAGGARPLVPPTASAEPAGDAPAVGPDDDAAELRTLALGALRAILADGSTAPPAVRVQAARAVLGLAPPRPAPAAPPAAGAPEADVDPAAALRVLRGRARALLADAGGA